MPIRLLAIFRSVEWPEKRGAHVATCVNGSLLVIIGGMTNFATMTSDGWIYDFTTMLWMKVLVAEIMFVVFYDYVKYCQKLYHIIIHVVVILYIVYLWARGSVTHM